MNISKQNWKAKINNQLHKNSPSDLELVKKIREGDSEAFSEVCRRYENIFYKICQRYVTPLSLSGINPQDIFDEKNFIILNCVKSYNPKKKTKLSTHIGNYARYLCLNSINERRFLLPTTDEDIQKHIEDHQAAQNFLSDNHYLQENFNYILNLLEQIKDPRVIEIFKLRYLNQKRMIWTQISKKLGISTQTAINLHNRGLELLKRKLTSQNISDVI